jgi:FtsZ-binding cell division protein ZapB
MTIETPISVGEYIDKLSILLIKKEKIKDNHKLENIKKEIDALLSKAEQFIPSELNSWTEKIKSVNLTLWDIEDKIRLKEKNKQFDQEFIDLARKVYYTNDERFLIKNEINEFFQSNLFEQKSYEDYK